MKIGLLQGRIASCCQIGEGLYPNPSSRLEPRRLLSSCVSSPSEGENVVEKNIVSKIISIGINRNETIKKMTEEHSWNDGWGPTVESVGLLSDSRQMKLTAQFGHTIGRGMYWRNHINEIIPHFTGNHQDLSHYGRKRGPCFRMNPLLEHSSDTSDRMQRIWFSYTFPIIDPQRLIDYSQNPNISPNRLELIFGFSILYMARRDYSREGYVAPFIYDASKTPPDYYFPNDASSTERSASIDNNIGDNIIKGCDYPLSIPQDSEKYAAGAAFWKGNIDVVRLMNLIASRSGIGKMGIACRAEVSAGPEIQFNQVRVDLKRVY